MAIQSIKGFKDLLPSEAKRWGQIEQGARRLFSLYGYEEIRTPILEFTEVFSRSIGEVTDIVEKEMYTFQDRDGRSVTMRPEGTAGVVRAYIEQALQSKSPIHKLFYMGPMFRHERPQAGRLRQFHQIGVEVLGPSGPAVDVEVISLLTDLLDSLEVRGGSLLLNSIGCPVCRPDYIATLRAFLEERRDRLCENCRRRIASNTLRVLDCKVPACREATEEAPAFPEHLCPACDSHFDAVRRGLTDLGIGFVQAPRLVRGLDYYTRTTFEWVTERLGAQNTVAAGGRYDGLVRSMGGPDVPGSGWAVGVERLASLCEGPASPPSPLVFFALLGEEAERLADPVIRRMRREGIRVERDLLGGSLKSQLRRADKAGASLVVIIGDEEIKRGSAVVRDMNEKTQAESSLSDLPEIIARRLRSSSSGQ
jgi:histidyl-tRNA synthetase